MVLIQFFSLSLVVLRYTLFSDCTVHACMFVRCMLFMSACVAIEDSRDSIHHSCFLLPLALAHGDINIIMPI